MLVFNWWCIQFCFFELMLYFHHYCLHTLISVHAYLFPTCSQSITYFVFQCNNKRYQFHIFLQQTFCQILLTKVRPCWNCNTKMMKQKLIQSANIVNYTSLFARKWKKKMIVPKATFNAKTVVNKPIFW